MSGSSRQGPTVKPVAMIIAAQMRVAIPKAATASHHAPVNVKSALNKAANSSPAAKAAFKRNAPAVKAATPHLKALAKQPGKAPMSSLRHGISAVHSLRKVTRDMAKQQSKSGAPEIKSSHALTPRAGKHVNAIQQSMQRSKPGLLSALGHGVQAMRAMRSVTKDMKKDQPASLLSAASALNDAKASSPKVAQAFRQAAPSAAKASAHIDALAQNQQRPNPSLLSSLGHGFQAMRALRGVTKAMAHPGKTDALPTHALSLRVMPSDRVATTQVGRPGSDSLSAFTKTKSK